MTVGSQSGRALSAGNTAALKDGGVAIYVSELRAADSSDLARSNIVLRSRVLFSNNLWRISPEVKPEMNASLTLLTIFNRDILLITVFTKCFEDLEVLIQGLSGLLTPCSKDMSGIDFIGGLYIEIVQRLHRRRAIPSLRCIGRS